MTLTVTAQRAQQVHERARARAGLPYVFGGAFTDDPRDSTDCSGLVLQTAAWYGGRTDWQGNRYGSTESFRLDYQIVYDLGFKRLPRGGVAALPFKPVMLVGLQHGGGGEYSHTACTLMTMDIPGGPVRMSDRGVDWESHGNVNGVGVSLYDGARAWNDPLFHDFWYLDAKLEDTPVSSGDAVSVLVRATGVSPARAGEILPTLGDGLRQAACINPNRIAMFIAQTGTESAGFDATEEYASGAEYEGRADLGNTQPGDGVRFKGRTWIQITGRAHYAEFSQWAHARGLVPTDTYFVDNPGELGDLKWAGIGAAWYWTVSRPDINTLSDRGDVVTVTRRINGGTHGLADRQTRYSRAITLGDQLLTLTTIGDDDFMSALTPDEQQEVLKLLRVLAKNPYPSRSPLRRLGEGNIDTIAGIGLNEDGNVHVVVSILLGLVGDPKTLADLADLADADLMKYPDRAGGKALATRILLFLATVNPALLQAQKGA